MIDWHDNALLVNQDKHVNTNFNIGLSQQRMVIINFKSSNIQLAIC